MSVSNDQDLGRIIEDFDRRITDTEQAIASPDFVAGSGDGVFPGPITIGDETPNPIVIDFNPPEQPESLMVTVGAIYDNIYADVEWEHSITGPPTQTTNIVWALGDDGAEIIGHAVVAGTSYRIENLEPNTDYSVRITPSSNIGVIGTATPWLNFTTGADTTIPPAPTGLIIGRGATTVVVKFTPLTATEARDVANGRGLYEIEIDTATTFDTVNLRSQRSGDQVVAFSDVTAEGTWYARIRAIDSSGNVSVWSATAGPATAGGVIDSMIVAGLDAAKITFGSMSGTRITTNTLAADRIATGTLAAATITLGTNGWIWAGTGFGGSTPTGSLVSAYGVILYKSGAVTCWLDAATGNASFTGAVSASTVTGSTISGTTISGGSITGTTYQTSSSNQRIMLEVQQYGGVGYQRSPRILLYPALDSAGVGPSEIQAEWTNSGSRGALKIHAPDAWNNDASLTLEAYSNQAQLHMRAGYISMAGLTGNTDVRLYGHLGVDTLDTYGLKNFRIPHPLHKGMELVHSVLEGPEAGIFYRGVGKTKKGRATIVLPDYFEALRRDRYATVYVTPRGVLTTICASDVEDGSFTVMSGEDCEFSWMVCSARGDIDPLEVEVSDGNRRGLEMMQRIEQEERAEQRRRELKGRQ